MIIDGHHHIAGDTAPILASMERLGIDCTVLVGVGVNDLNVVTIRDSLIFRMPWLLKTVGVWKSKAIVRSRALQEALLPQPDNERVAKAIRDFPNRFRGFAFVNPAHPQAVAEVENRLAAGFCGIKMALLQYPVSLESPEMFALCEIANSRRVPVFFHQGVTPATSNPEAIFKRFSKVSFIIAHAGVQYFGEAIELARAYPNVWLDTSSYFVTAAKLQQLIRELGPKKMVFGSDVPVMAFDQAEALNKIIQLPISEHDRTAILGDNLQRILDNAKN